MSVQREGDRLRRRDDVQRRAVGVPDQAARGHHLEHLCHAVGRVLGREAGHPSHGAGRGQQTSRLERVDVVDRGLVELATSPEPRRRMGRVGREAPRRVVRRQLGQGRHDRVGARGIPVGQRLVPVTPRVGVRGRALARAVRGPEVHPAEVVDEVGHGPAGAGGGTGAAGRRRGPWRASPRSLLAGPARAWSSSMAATLGTGQTGTGTDRGQGLTGTSRGPGSRPRHGIRSGREHPCDAVGLPTRTPSAAGPRSGHRAAHRARCRVPGRPARRPRTRVWWSAPARPRRRWATRSSCSATTTSATRSSSSPTSPATRSSWPRTRRRRPDAPYIVFCGVHFMAESADILTSESQTVILPDLAAGCSMADMAAIRQVEDAWDDLVEAGVADVTIPVTYMNSSAAIKAFTGRHGGTICTSSNAKTALTWALGQAGEGGKVLFLPDQHLGRNTYVRDLGGELDGCVVFDPHKPMGGLTRQELADATMILWRGPLLGARPVQPGRRRAGPAGDPRRQGDRPPRVPARGRRGCRRGRLVGPVRRRSRRSTSPSPSGRGTPRWRWSAATR